MLKNEIIELFKNNEELYLYYKNDVVKIVEIYEDFEFAEIIIDTRTITVSFSDLALKVNKLYRCIKLDEIADWIGGRL